MRMNNTSRAAELDLHDSHSQNNLPVRAASPYLTRGSITGNRQPSAAVPRSWLESTVCYDGLCMHLRMYMCAYVVCVCANAHIYTHE